MPTWRKKRVAPKCDEKLSSSMTSLTLLDLSEDELTIQIPLEVNITSNICLHIYNRAGSHPFPHLDRMGVPVTLNSDDPPLFNTDLTHEYTLLMDEFGYSLADVARIARNAFVAAAAPEPLRNKLLLELDTWVKANVTPALTAQSHEALPQ